jgi:hypothetical protein
MKTKRSQLVLKQLGDRVKEDQLKGEQALDKLREYDRKNLQIELEKERQKELDDAHGRQARGEAAVACLIATAVMVAGFFLWYFKSQRYQDEATLLALREQSAKTESAELQLQEARKKKSVVIAPATSAQPITVVINNPASPSATVPLPPATAARAAP